MGDTVCEQLYKRAYLSSGRFLTRPQLGPFCRELKITRGATGAVPQHLAPTCAFKRAEAAYPRRHAPSTNIPVSRVALLKIYTVCKAAVRCLIYMNNPQRKKKKPNNPKNNPPALFTT